MANSDPGHWLLRGAQSAIAYYLACTPCVDRKYKKQRRAEARAAGQEVIVTQPGTIQQPGAFQTNEQWAEELMLGPGPPKPWKPDELLAKVKKRLMHHEEPSRPSIDRRISDAYENVKESLRLSLHPEKWNWKRYDREDEVLWGLTDKVTKIWDRVTERRPDSSHSDRNYLRGRIPAINDLSPPVVSQLPATREEAAWMMLPPPNAAVMSGKMRPGDEMMRRPMCVIGRPEAEEWESDVETNRPSYERHVSAPTPAKPTILSEDNRHFSDPIHILKPPLAVTTNKDLETRSDILPLAGTVTPKPRPSSWQFHYIVPISRDV